MTDAGLKELAGIKGLQTLDLWLHQGDGRGAERAGRPQGAAGAGPTHAGDGRGAEGAGRVKGLHMLDLRETKVTDAGLKELAALKGCSSWTLSKRR